MDNSPTYDKIGEYGGMKMREKIHVEQTERNENNQIILIVNKDILVSELVTTGQMLVDSEQLSFIYVVERDEEFSYLELGWETWLTLKEGLEFKCDYFLSNGNQSIKLTGFRNELLYLIDNIKGNSNYGEEMVTKVEECFCN